jgi:type IV pilus assembly protein PilM
MLNSKSFLAVDFGAGSLKLAEFEVNEAGGLRLKQYGIKSLGAEGSQESTREKAILEALQGLIAEKGISAKQVNVCAPGFHVFSKFVKLPPVETSKVQQIIQYEAQQNVPFPLEEVVWDYQILGTTAGGELEVLLVAIKADVVEGLFRVAEKAGLRLQLADVSPAALCNAFRYNYGDVEECTMLLDIGAKTSNLLFFEKGKVYSRSISIGANAITQDFSNESKLKFDDAEKLKINEGFVSLGGAYEEPENPNQAAISKIARQFMTRLHIQVNQTMQFYRGQQGGSAPQRLFLSGGASIMPYTAQFFAEKLNVPVEYFNPLRNVQIDPSIDLEELARVAHSFGEVIGLGLRNLAHCPVELNLMPESTLKWQSFNQKKPYLIATVFSLVLIVAAIGWLFQKLGQVKEKELTEVKPLVEQLQRKESQFKKAFGDLKRGQQDVDQVMTWMEDRYYWMNLLSELREVMKRVEVKVQQKRTDTGVWVEKLMALPAGASTAPSSPYELTPEMARARFGGVPPSAEPAPQLPPEAVPLPGAVPSPMPEVVGGPPGTNDTFEITCRAVSLSATSPEAQAPNQSVALAVLSEMQASMRTNSDGTVTNWFDVSGTVFKGDVVDDTDGTFRFVLTVKLKQPLKL